MLWQDDCPSVRLSVCLSVRLSVTRQYSVETAKYIIKAFSVGRPVYSSFLYQTGWQYIYTTGTPYRRRRMQGGITDHDF